MTTYLLDANVFIQAKNLGVGVKCVTPYQMLRSERARFVLNRSS